LFVIKAVLLRNLNKCF